MAASGDLHFHRFPQSKSVDAVRWLSAASAFDRLFAVAVHDPDALSSALEIQALTLNPSSPESKTLTVRSSWPSPARISALRAAHSHRAVAVATVAGSLHVLLFDPVDGSVESEVAVGDDRSLHDGVIAGVDVGGEGREWVTVGEDGKVNLVSVGEGRLNWRRVGDSKGLVSYNAVKWGSPAEFATGGLGFGVQWWDLRKPEGLIAQLKGSWGRYNVTGMVHSIDIHPSRKHICVVGGSSGTILAWDLRNQQQPIVLSGVGLTGAAEPVSESEVWEIQHDTHSQSSSITTGPGKTLPIMMCSEDGFLTVLEQGEEPLELLAEPCAINAFDIDPQNPSDVVCALEWESIGILTRSRESMSSF